MAAASLVASALGIVLLIVTAYVLVGGTISTSDLMISAQKDVTALQIERMGTSMEIQSFTGSDPLFIMVDNSGQEPIRNFENVDVYLFDSTGLPILFRYNQGSFTWKKEYINPDDIYPNQWDPGETLNMSVNYAGPRPKAVQVTTANGISARA